MEKQHINNNNISSNILISKDEEIQSSSLNSSSLEEEYDKKLVQELNEQSSLNIYVNHLELNEKSDEDLLNLSKEEIIEFKNYEILKLKAYIESLEKEKEDLINNYKNTSNVLLERIKELEFKQNGFRPETPMISHNIRKTKGVTINDFNSPQNSVILNNKTQRCPNCTKEISLNEYIPHSLECLRKRYRCQKCNLLMDSDNKINHFRSFYDVNQLKKAIQNSDQKYVRLSVEHGFNFNSVILDEENGDMLIHYLARYDHVNYISSIWKEININVNILNKNKETALIIAIEKKNSSSVKELIKIGANIKIRNKADMSPLMLVCKNGLTDIADILIQKGIDVNEKNILGETPLKIAQMNNNEELAMKLIQQYKADISFK